MKTHQKYRKCSLHTTQRQKSPFLCRSLLCFWCPSIKILWNLWPRHCLFLFCLCVYLPINASWCLDSQRIASSLTLSQKTKIPSLGESNNPLNSLLYLSMTLLVLWCLERSYVHQQNMHISQTPNTGKINDIKLTCLSSIYSPLHHCN